MDWQWQWESVWAEEWQWKAKWTGQGRGQAGHHRRPRRTRRTRGSRSLAMWTPAGVPQNDETEKKGGKRGERRVGLILDQKG